MKVDVHILDRMVSGNVVREYYEGGGGDRFGPYAQVLSAASVEMFRHFDHLLDQLLASKRSYHIVVSHGTQNQGLLMAFQGNAQVPAQPGMAMKKLAELADHMQANSRRSTSFGFRQSIQSRLNTLKALTLIATDAQVLQLVDKLIAVRKRKIIIYVRGCNVGKNVAMVRDYRAALGCLRLFVPKCSNGFVPINFGPGVNNPNTLQTNANATSNGTVRTRSLPSTQSPRAVVRITDLGPGRFNSNSWRDNGQDQPKVANTLIRDANMGFSAILTFMWPDTPATEFFFVKEKEYSDQLLVVT